MFICILVPVVFLVSFVSPLGRIADTIVGIGYILVGIIRVDFKLVSNIPLVMFICILVPVVFLVSFVSPLGRIALKLGGKFYHKKFIGFCGLSFCPSAVAVYGICVHLVERNDFVRCNERIPLLELATF
ncbi:hypothetical protein IV203_024179 [Nitzschia inconspicua]|uniref:Uncharacterized protein n=1 Tax=Nitzschia inconspicua TaxID=303405 RepID=A0A9K3KCG2_9STRA|nr:hypothetical protein IV203_024179 [Nitzschia inconspicua]